MVCLRPTQGHYTRLIELVDPSKNLKIHDYETPIDAAAASTAGVQALHKIDQLWGHAIKRWDVPDRMGETALFAAAASGQSGSIRFLLSKGADPAHRANDGCTSVSFPPPFAKVAHAWWRRLRRVHLAPATEMFRGMAPAPTCARSPRGRRFPRCWESWWLSVTERSVPGCRGRWARRRP